MSNQPTAEVPALPPVSDRIKSAAFGFTTALSTPLYGLSPEVVDKAARVYVGRMKQAHQRMRGVKAILREYFTKEAAAKA